MLNRLQNMFQSKDEEPQQECATDAADDAPETNREEDLTEQERLDALIQLHGEPVDRDRAAVNLLDAVGQILNLKRLSEEQVEDLRERLKTSQSNVQYANRDLKQAHVTLEESQRRMDELKENLAAKNVQIDQLMEDYRTLQREMEEKTEELESIREVERAKHEKIYDQMEREQNKLSKALKETEETVYGLEAENQNLKGKLARAKEENDYLISVVDDFTSQVAASRPPAPKGQGDGNGEDR